MGFNVGLNIVEVDGSASPAIVGASTSVAAFNIATQRGLPQVAVAVTSFRQFTERFGGYFPGGLGPYLVKGFFDNGGQTAYVNRVVSSDAQNGAKAASITLTDSANNNTLKLSGGFRGADDPGTWAERLHVSVEAATEVNVRLRESERASATGTALAATVNMTSAPKLSLVVDGKLETVELVPADFPDATAATPAQIRDAINRKTSNIVASLSENKLVLTSTGAVAKLKGDFTTLQVKEANTPLGFATAMAEPVAGKAADLTETATRLADVSPFTAGDALRLGDGTHQAFTKLLSVNPVTGDVAWQSVSNFNDFDKLKLRISRATFTLRIAHGGTEEGDVVETWPNLSMERDAANYVERVINDKLTGSKYLVADDLDSNSKPGLDMPKADTGFAPLATGADGTPTAKDFIGDEAKRTGFNAFDPYDVQLLACERTDPDITTAALGYCEKRGDCMYFGAVPQNFVAAGQAIAYGQAFQAKKVYGALYGPWIVISDPAGSGANPLKTVPPVGHVMGVAARIANSRGIWKAPAGDEANLIGALDVECRLSDAEHTALVKQGSVNGIRAVPRSGIIVDASRTLSTDTRWLYVNVRLLFNYVKSSLKDGLRWVRQEPNRDTLWDAIRIQTVTPFLMGLWRQGAFGTGTAAQVFKVICDASNNPPEQVDQGNLTVEIYFYPSKPAETIVIVVGQQQSGASASES
jgi:hypothetical protein